MSGFSNFNTQPSQQAGSYGLQPSAAASKRTRRHHAPTRQQQQPGLYGNPPFSLGGGAPGGSLQNQQVTGLFGAGFRPAAQSGLQQGPTALPSPWSAAAAPTLGATGGFGASRPSISQSQSGVSTQSARRSALGGSLSAQSVAFGTGGGSANPFGIMDVVGSAGGANGGDDDKGLNTYHLLDPYGNRTGAKYRNKSSYGAALKAAQQYDNIYLQHRNHPKVPKGGSRVYWYAGTNYVDPNPTDFMIEHGITKKANVKSQGYIDYDSKGNILKRYGDAALA